MQLNYINSQGDEKSVNGAAELAEAIKSGRITSQTLVRTGAEQKWVPAGTHAECLAFSGGDASLLTAQDISQVAKVRRRGRLAWYGAFAVILVGGGLGRVSAYSLGQLFAGALLWGLIILVIVAVIRRKRSPLDQERITTKAGIWFAVLCCLSVIGYIIEAAGERSEAKRIADSFEQHVVDMEQSLAGTTTSQQGAPVVPQTSLEPRRAESNLSAGRPSLLIEDVFARQKAMQDRYAKVVESSGLENVLVPANLASADGRRSSRAALTTVNAALTTLNSEIAAYYNDVVRLPEKYGFSEVGAEEFRNGFAKSFKENRPKTDRIIQLEREMLEVTAEIISFVEARPIPVELGDDQLLFAYDYEVDEYNRLVEGMTARATEQSKLQAAMLQLMRETGQKYRKQAE